MKLRNKKTGEITEAISIHDGFICVDWKGDSGIYRTLASLNKEFEDYKPKEPLIKDEKIRKAVRAFAELNNSATIIFELSYGKSSIIARADNGFAMLWVAGESWETNGKGIKWDEPYTIAELCGEGEDCNKPAEPLIKDEKIRKAVRAWAEMNDIRFIHMCSRTRKENARIVGQNALGRTFTMEIDNEYEIRVCFKDYKESYTIAELCGEEEEWVTD